MKPFFSTRHYFLSLLTLSLLFVGCGPRIDEAGRHNIRGVITYDGTPLPTGDIFFTPLETKAPPGAARGGGVAHIQSNGTYSLTRDAGLFEGTYQVAIRSSKVVHKGTGADVDLKTITETEMENTERIHLLPEKFYNDPQITITVGTAKNQTRDFRLEK